MEGGDNNARALLIISPIPFRDRSSTFPSWHNRVLHSLCDYDSLRQTSTLVIGVPSGLAPLYVVVMVVPSCDRTT
jgi:hypothetical protein